MSMGQTAQRPPRGARMVYSLAHILSLARVLSMLIHEEARKFAYQTGVKVVVAYGGAPINQQLQELERNVDILVATPGRYLALVEADRMLDMGFQPRIRRTVEQMDMPRPGLRQTILFNVTFTKEIQQLASDFLANYRANGVQGKQALTLVFVETTKDADSFEHWLCINGFSATSIHGDKTQQEREQALRSLKSHNTPILVATDDS
ncbi:hypothetical protein Tsubulata_032058 [Turnera subulata]|uniref:RNA helicase n=1 Tax=Turnera subulata TaxID=218843 RepID=A0A9Q0J0M3_9ROSI|nr:hypothetical protein Tsubulata_032058 [Turnera subulata]